MIYRIDYLINKDYYYSYREIIKKAYNIDYGDYFEIKIKWIDYLLKLIRFFIYYEYPNYCIDVIYGGKEYFGISDKNLEKFKQQYLNLNFCYSFINIDCIKSIKEVMIEEIVG